MQRTLPRAPQECFERFCEVAAIPDWVDRVIQADVRREHPDGRPAEVDFVARRADGTEVQYSLAYAYDREGLRVSWRPREGEQDAVMGYASFEPGLDAGPDETGCTMTYALQQGYAWDAETRDLKQVTQDLADAFAHFVGL